MEVILLERVAKLGQMGEVVRVRDGFGRNFPARPRQGAARHRDNRKRFESQRIELETRNLELKSEADAVAETLNGQSVVILRQSGESGVLYGSVSTRDIAESLTRTASTSPVARSR
jgi:large subunit ribosomal protein L9